MAAGDHTSVVRESFTRQAEAYAASPVIYDRERLLRLVAAVTPHASDRVLDVATGPGYLAMAFAERCGEVVGVDLTDAPLAIARRTAGQRGLCNLTFQSADANRLPFGDDEFDIVVSRLAFHHFEGPGRVLREMARVSRRLVAVEDLAASEHSERAAYQNRFEQLRDPSHTRALPISEMLGLFRNAGLELTKLFSGELVQNLERWLANTQTPPGRADEVRRMIEDDAGRDLSGCSPYQQDGEWYFRQLMIAVVARKI
jgi:ubiquinone/menaquinone biosynthesis C-methylase UbiE